MNIRFFYLVVDSKLLKEHSKNMKLFYNIERIFEKYTNIHLIYIEWPEAHFKLCKTREYVLERRIKHFAIYQTYIQIKFLENISRVIILDIYICKGY